MSIRLTSRMSYSTLSAMAQIRLGFVDKYTSRALDAFLANCVHLVRQNRCFHTLTIAVSCKHGQTSGVKLEDGLSLHLKVLEWRSSRFILPLGPSSLEKCSIVFHIYVSVLTRYYVLCISKCISSIHSNWAIQSFKPMHDRCINKSLKLVYSQRLGQIFAMQSSRIGWSTCHTLIRSR